MLLFFIGTDATTIGLIVLLLLVFGRLIFWLTNKLFRKVLKDPSDKKVKLLSRVSAFIVSPVIVIGSFALFIYISIRNAPKESNEEMERNQYEMLEKDLRKDLKVGMSKTDVIGLFGETDTTRSFLLYDLSLYNVKEKYILEIEFDAKGLKDFKRQR